jgi:hypothetical protein
VALFQAFQSSALTVCTAKQMSKSLAFVVVGSECHAIVSLAGWQQTSEFLQNNWIPFAMFIQQH